MGRTVPSFRIVIAEEKAEWKPFRNALDKSERKEFDEMWNIPRLYVSACSNSVQLVPFHPIAISILFHHYKELKECISKVEQMIQEASSSHIDAINKRRCSSSNKNTGLSKEEQKEEEEITTTTTTLDEFIFYYKNMLCWDQMGD